MFTYKIGRPLCSPLAQSYFHCCLYIVEPYTKTNGKWEIRYFLFGKGSSLPHVSNIRQTALRVQMIPLLNWEVRSPIFDIPPQMQAKNKIWAETEILCNPWRLWKDHNHPKPSTWQIVTVPSEPTPRWHATIYKSIRHRQIKSKLLKF